MILQKSIITGIKCFRLTLRLHELKQNVYSMCVFVTPAAPLIPLCVSTLDVCCISMWQWMDSAQHWAHRGDFPAAAGARVGRPVCDAPPRITQRWLRSVADRWDAMPSYID